MTTISIYNNYLPHSKDMREELSELIKYSGFKTGRGGKYIIVIGGDGTFLKAIQKNMSNKQNPIFIGINTGNLGFLSEFTFKDTEKIMNLIKSGDYGIQILPIYKAIITFENGKKGVYRFINDLVVERKSSRIIHTSVKINQKGFCDVSGDGVVISTSLGSTGYAISSGGSVSYDCDNVLQINPLNPVQSKAYHSLTNTIILKDTNELMIYPKAKKRRRFRVVVDGEEIKGSNISSVVVEKSKETANLLRSKGFDNTKNLREKILEEE